MVWPDCDWNPWSTALEASTLTITPPMWFKRILKVYTIYIFHLVLQVVFSLNWLWLQIVFQQIFSYKFWVKLYCIKTGVGGNNLCWLAAILLWCAPWCLLILIVLKFYLQDWLWCALNITFDEVVSVGVCFCLLQGAPYLIKLSVLVFVFSSPCQRQCELLPSLGVRCPSSVNFSHFNLLHWNP